MSLMDLLFNSTDPINAVLQADRTAEILSIKIPFRRLHFLSKSIL